MLYDYHLTPTHIHTSKISVPRAKLQPHRFGGKPKNTPCVVLIALFRLGFGYTYGIRYMIFSAQAPNGVGIIRIFVLMTTMLN